MNLALHTAENEALSKILLKAYSPDSELSDLEPFRLRLLFLTAMRSYEATAAQQSHGFFDTSQFQGRVSNIYTWLQFSHFSQWWTDQRELFSEELQALVDESLERTRYAKR
jgi:hypothetical protein